ncbi:hypothetical protein [Pseudomonas sp. TWI929]|uniref:hypothetical protein n=1 Tax=Pseudomonas sp. TWI929 TaxID=3136795 RepID=UPI00320B3110
MEITQLLKTMLRYREALEAHGIRDTGGYAELLAARALCASRNKSSVEKGFDILCPQLGRIEVRSRCLPRSGRHETRIELSDKKEGGFDYLLGILFDPDIEVVGGFLLPHHAAISLSRLQQFKRIPFATGLAHPQAIDITEKLRLAQQQL